MYRRRKLASHMKDNPMRKIILSSSVIIAALSLSACGSDSSGGNERSKTSGNVTQTRMDDIDKIEGTINDDMINVDETTESAPLAKNDKKGAGSSDKKE